MLSGLEESCMSNPYESPRTGEPSHEVELKASPWPTLVFLVGLMFLVAAIFLVFLAFTLRREYPGLHDPSPLVDGYWPAVVHDIYHLLAGLSVIFAIVCTIGAGMLRRTRRIEDAELNTSQPQD